jgi:hypothetical protein
MQKILEEKVAALVAEYHEKAPGLTTAEAAALSLAIKQARHELQAFLSDGATGCVICGEIPLIVKHRRPAGNLVVDVYEAGCLADHADEGGKPLERNRVYAQNLAEAIAAWNDRQAELAAA